MQRSFDDIQLDPIGPGVLPAERSLERRFETISIVDDYVDTIPLVLGGDGRFHGDPKNHAPIARSREFARNRCSTLTSSLFTRSTEERNAPRFCLSSFSSLVRRKQILRRLSESFRRKSFHSLCNSSYNAAIYVCAICRVSNLLSFLSLPRLGTTSRSLSKASFRLFILLLSRAFAASRLFLNTSIPGVPFLIFCMLSFAFWPGYSIGEMRRASFFWWYLDGPHLPPCWL